MELPSHIRFFNDKIKQELDSLENGNNDEKALFKEINAALDRLEKDAFCGIHIPKRLIPKEYKKKFKTENLWKYNLPNGWRLLYSIVNDEVIVISLVLEWLDHKEYERRFKY